MKPNRIAQKSGIALCLGSSYFGFYAHAGFLDVIVEQGIVPEHLVGCSSGAIVAGLYAAGLSPAAIRDFLFETNFRTSVFEWTIPLCGIAMTFNLPGVSGITSGKRLMHRFKKAVGDLRIEDVPGFRLSIAVTNLSTGRSEILDRGPLAEAMLASCAIPIIFRPVKTHVGYCWDGGLANALPIDHFGEAEDIRTVIVHHINAHGSSYKETNLDREPSIVRSCSTSYQIMHEQIYRMSQERLRHLGKRVIPCQTDTVLPSIFSRKSRVRCLEDGAQTARNLNDQWQALAAATENLSPQPS